MSRLAITMKSIIHGNASFSQSTNINEFTVGDILTYPTD